ncbi:MAG: hypothetical protein IKK75_00705 [Clostridia bacterium]|nr:hypothetical protein [Clostridia bacterium]
MRKFLLLLLLLASVCLCTAAHADVFVFDDFSAMCEIDGSKYTILTQDNLHEHADWLTSRGLTPESVAADWADRGVYLQAWTASGDACLEITAVQDDFAAQYYDVNEITTDERKTFRLGHSSDKDGFYRARGYDYSSADWKNMKNTGRFLVLAYTRTVGGESYCGYAQKTIRNGWTIMLEYQVYGRSAKSSDRSALEKVMDTWEFTEVWPRPVTSVSPMVFTSRPPLETNSNKFTVKGTGTPGLRIIGVVMRMSASDVEEFETTIDKNGKFSLTVTLPREGVWLMTYVVENAGVVVDEGVFDAITYQKDLLPITLSSVLPTTLTGNEIVISGVTMSKAMVQCIVDGRYQKSITTGNSGEFSFKIDTSEEGEYTFTLVFEKKGYTSRRFSSTATRTYTDADRRAMIRDSVVSPAYKTLTSKLSGYKGDYMVYTLHIQSVDQTPTGYLIFAGMSKSKAGVISNMVVIRSTEAPEFVPGDKVKLYLRCIDSYEYITDDGVQDLPYFDLQWME